MGAALKDLLLGIENSWQSEVQKLSEDELLELAKRMDSVASYIKEYRIRRIHRRREEEDATAQIARKASLNNRILNTEAMRQVLPFLTAVEVCRTFLLGCKSLIQDVGEELVWKSICEGTWGRRNGSADLLTHPVIGMAGTYKNYFFERNKPISLASEELSPIPTAALSSARLSLTVDLWKDSDTLLSTTVDGLSSLVTQSSITVPLRIAIEVGQLPREKAHQWNLPNFFEGGTGRARLQLFRAGVHSEGNGSTPTTPLLQSSTVLDTEYSFWLGWAKYGEMTFLQQQRTVGLEMTDRGRWIQNRIIDCRHPQWMGYRGLQFKMVLMCEQLQTEGDPEFIRFGFTKARIEAIRLHENTHGNIRHHIFRKDQGWQKHGVTLNHLLNELR